MPTRVKGRIGILGPSGSPSISPGIRSIDIIIIANGARRIAGSILDIWLNYIISKP